VRRKKIVVPQIESRSKNGAGNRLDDELKEDRAKIRIIAASSTQYYQIALATSPDLGRWAADTYPATATISRLIMKSAKKPRQLTAMFGTSSSA